MILEFAAAASKSKVANGALAGSEAPDIIEAKLDEDTAEGAEEGGGEEGWPRGAAPELRGVQDRRGTQAGKKDGREFGANF